MSESRASLRGPVPGSKKVGRKPAFTAAEAVEAAFAEGIDRFTLAAVAQRLGVVPASIYRLFPSRDDLVIVCLDAAGGTFALPRPEMGWRQVLQLWGDECWSLCEEYPGLERVLFSTPVATMRIEPVFCVYAEHLGEQGITPRQVMFALDFIGDTVLASHLGVASMRARRDDGRTGLDAARSAVLSADALLHPQDSWVSRSMLDTKLELILQGLARFWPEVSD